MPAADDADDVRGSPTEPVVAPVSSFSGTLSPGPLEIDPQRAARADENWRRAVDANPTLYDGPILLAQRLSIVDGALEAQYRETRFSRFLWLRQGGFADRSVVNVFGAAAVVSSDGAVLLARMAAHTANPGNVYFPAGLPDLEDAADGRVDLEGSILRELLEETGLRAPLVRATDLRLAVFAGFQVACVRRFDCALDRVGLVAEVSAHIARDGQAELDSVLAVGAGDPLPSTAPGYVRAAIPFILGSARA